MMKCDFCGEPYDNGRHPLTESGAYDVRDCQCVFLLRKTTELESRLDRALYLLNDAIANAELDGPAAIDVAAAAVLVSEIESERNGTDYVVRCARCGRALTAHLAVPEEGDEWECPPCNAAHHKIERLELLRDEAAELIGLTLKDHDVGLTEDVGLAYRDRCNKWLSNAGVVERQAPIMGFPAESDAEELRRKNAFFPQTFRETED